MKDSRIVIVAGLILALAAAAGAQQGSPYPGDYGRIYSGSPYYGNTASDDLYSDRMPQDSMGQSQTRLQGEIMSVRIRSINNQPMFVAQVQTQNNRTVPVLLGSPSRLSGLDLQPGDPVTIVGRRVRLNQQPALKASHIRADGQSFQVGQAIDQPQRRQTDQRMQDQSDGRPMQQQQPTMQMSGTIEDIQQVKIYGQQELHAVAAVSTRDGQTRVVDLGPQSQLEPLALRTGDRIQVRGVRGSINNNPVVAARQVSSGGQSAMIRRDWNRRDFRIKGRVADTRIVSIQGTEHVIATVATDQGRRVSVDLGPLDRLREKNIDLSQGQQITLIVQPSRTGGRPMLKAGKIGINNRVLQRNI